MSKKVWSACLNCDFYPKCLYGKDRTVGINKDNPIWQDIGCFDAEQYRKQIEDKQLKLF